MKIHYRYAILITWMLVIFFLSNEVADTSSDRSAVIVDALSHSFIGDLWKDSLTFITRKAAHIIAYFILGIFAYNVTRTYKLSTKRAILLSIAFALIYAVSDEIHQLFVPGRSGEIRDVLIDTTASTVGIYAYYLIRKRRVNRVNSNNKV